MSITIRSTETLANSNTQGKCDAVREMRPYMPKNKAGKYVIVVTTRLFKEQTYTITDNGVTTTYNERMYVAPEYTDPPFEYTPQEIDAFFTAYGVDIVKTGSFTDLIDENKLIILREVTIQANWQGMSNWIEDNQPFAVVSQFTDITAVTGAKFISSNDPNNINTGVDNSTQTTAGQNIGGTITQDTSRDNLHNQGFNIFFDMLNTLSTTSTSWKVSIYNPNFTITGAHNGIVTTLADGTFEIVNESYNGNIASNGTRDLQLVGQEVGADGTVNHNPTYSGVYIEIT